MTHKERVKEDFKRRVNVVKSNLPPYYGVIVRDKQPDIKASTMYNVLHNYTHNEDVLLKLEELFNKQ